MADSGLSIPDATRLADEYRRELGRLQRAGPTILIYDRGMRTLLDSARAVGIVNRESIRRWMDELCGRMSGASAALYGVSVRKMLDWAADNGECDRALARAVPPGKYERFRLPRPLRPEHLLKIDAYLRSRPTESLGLRDLRDRALFYYVRATGARVGEFLQVRRANFESETVRQTQRPHGEKVLVPPTGVVAIIRQYLAARTDDLEWLWIAVKTNGEITQLGDSGAAKVWERLARKADVPRFTSRQLRQTAGAMLAERGRDVIDIMVHMGAKDARSVQGYKELVSRSRIDEVRADLDVAPV